MTRTLHHPDHADPAEALLRETFAAAANGVVPGPRPTLEDRTAPVVSMIRPSRRSPARWAAAAAVVALLGGATWQLGTGNDRLDVATAPTTPDPSSPYTAFAEPTWLPDGVVPVLAVQDGRPPAFTADIVTVDDEHATLHWTYAPHGVDSGWHEADGSTDPKVTALVGGPVDEGFHAWGEPTAAPYVISADSPRTPPKPATTDTISALLEDLLSQCRPDYTCEQFRPAGTDGIVKGAHVIRQGPDESNLGQSRISYASELGAPMIRTSTWTTTGVIPDGSEPVPVRGLYPPPLDEPAFRSERVTVDGRPGLYIAGSDQSMVIVEYPDQDVSVAVQSERTVGTDSIGTTAPADQDTLLRIARSIRIRPGSEFTSTARRYAADVSGQHLTTVETGSTAFEVYEYTGPASELGCPIIGVARQIGSGENVFGGDICSLRSTGDPDLAQLFGVATHDGHRLWIGTFDDAIDSVRITLGSGEVIGSHAVAVPGRPIHLVAVDLPAGAGTVELLAADGTPRTITRSLSFTATDAHTVG